MFLYIPYMNVCCFFLVKQSLSVLSTYIFFFLSLFSKKHFNGKTEKLSKCDEAVVSSRPPSLDPHHPTWWTTVLRPLVLQYC